MNLLILFIILIAVWTIAWKGYALWTAARNNQKYWFIVLLIVNTAGILEIIYLKRRQKKAESINDEKK